MIICMCEVFVFTNRSLCREDFLSRIEQLAKARPKAIVLREKDLEEHTYQELAKEVISICEQYGTICILHKFASVAAAFNHRALHVPLPVLRSMSEEERRRFPVLGASCHSLEDAEEAEKLHCTYITAGHIFDTDCKKGLPGRGLEFLKEICHKVSIPVYAIGGMDPEHMEQVMNAGAAGVCVMSGAMVCDNVTTYLSSFRRNGYEIS